MRWLKETARRTVELCDGSLQGIASAMSLIAYYNVVADGAMINELEKLNGMMTRKLSETKNDEKGLDLECRFDEEQVRKSGIVQTPKIVLAAMDHMLRSCSRSDAAADDYAIAMYAVLSSSDNYEGSRADFVKMVRSYFKVELSYDALQRWISRNGIDFDVWGTKTAKACKRQALADDFKKLIEKVRAYKSINL